MINVVIFLYKYSNLMDKKFSVCCSMSVVPCTFSQSIYIMYVYLCARGKKTLKHAEHGSSKTNARNSTLKYNPVPFLLSILTYLLRVFEQQSHKSGSLVCASSLTWALR